MLCESGKKVYGRLQAVLFWSRGGQLFCLKGFLGLEFTLKRFTRERFGSASAIRQFKPVASMLGGSRQDAENEIRLWDDSHKT